MVRDVRNDKGQTQTRTQTEMILPIKKELAEGQLFKRQEKHERTREARDDKRSTDYGCYRRTTRICRIHIPQVFERLATRSIV